MRQFSVLILSLGIVLYCTDSPSATDEPIRSVAEFNEFLSGRPKPLRHFELTGLVTHMNGSDQVILSDDSGRALIPHVAQPPPAVGDIVRICGDTEEKVHISVGAKRSTDTRRPSTSARAPCRRRPT